FSGDTTALRMRLAVPLRNRDRKSPLNIGASRGRREPRSRIDYERGIRHHARERAPRKNRVGGGDPIITGTRSSQCPGWESNPHVPTGTEVFKTSASDRFRHPGNAIRGAVPPRYRSHGSRSFAGDIPEPG